MPQKKSSGESKMTEEELILLESSRHVSMATSALFYGNAFIVSALPLCKWSRDSKNCHVCMYKFGWYFCIILLMTYVVQ